ncbi:MAG TPA: cupredoxin family copper-binding protein [Candidatus Udaeobacter sp.]|nr:cupredoxin family copper-binding protein [Candidatus Udaeobacter sp.]
MLNTMKKILALGSVLSIVALMGAGCAATNYSAQPTSQQTPQTSTQSEAAQVVISGFAFSPASLTVKAGTTVKWTNDDQAPHSIVSSDGQFTGSSVLSTGGTYQFKFDKPGTYTYSCGIHPSMHGQVVVQ